MKNIRQGGRAASLRADDRGVTAIEYAVLMGFLAILAFPFMLGAANALWNGGGSASSVDAVVGRGPYNYPDGNVKSAQQIERTPYQVCTSICPFYTMMPMTAASGNLYQTIQLWDFVNNTKNYFQVPYFPGVQQGVLMPDSGLTIYVGGTLDGASPGKLPQGTNPLTTPTQVPPP